MNTPNRKPLYRASGAALLRAAASPLSHAPDWWPDLTDTEQCRTWLYQVWSRADLADAIKLASPVLADRIEILHTGRPVQGKQIRRAATSTTRYLLRATGRPTPFGLFAGVARVSLGPTAKVRWGNEHRPAARVDTQWLADIIERLEACPELLERLDVVFNNLATQRGGRMEAPHGPNRVAIGYSSPVRAVREASASPIRCAALADKLIETFPGADGAKALGMLSELVRQGLLITNLRAPLTVPDPLEHLVNHLGDAGADSLPEVAPLLRALESIQDGVRGHNDEADGAGQRRMRRAIIRQMSEVSQVGRTPLAVDLKLDCDVQLPHHVAAEMEQAADALLRLTRQPTGDAAWHDFHAAFVARYGLGTLVPLAEAIDPDAGLGFPAGYPGSVLPPPNRTPSERDERLLALAWQAVADDSREITLGDESIDALADGTRLHERHVPPHVELAARIHAPSVEALNGGEYTLTIAPARSAGTLTSRFTPTATGSGLEEVYRALPVASEDALPVQLSFPPVYSHAENVCRVPAYLPHVLPLGEHRGSGTREPMAIALDDLAVTATRESLHLVSVSRSRVVEPQVFHALALEKQPPPLARFLAHLTRGFAAVWHEFDWGPHARRLPYLPRVRYRRTVISPARWRLTADDLPANEPGQDAWRHALDRWRRRWHCPVTVELCDADRTLRLTLDEPAHAAILHAQLQRNGEASLMEAAAAEVDFGWIVGHAHEIALPFVKTNPAAPCPLVGPLPQVINTHGHLPGSADAQWLYAKVYTHPERHSEIIAQHLPQLLAVLGDEAECWFVRYRSPHETDHLRLRIRVPERGRYAMHAAAVGDWAQRLRENRVAGRLVFDTYVPEAGRYGHGTAMDAAESAFSADSRVVSAALGNLPTAVIDPTALVAVNMVDIASSFLGSPDEAMNWLIARPAPDVVTDRAVAGQVVRVARSGNLGDRPDWPTPVREAWQARAAALAAYRQLLPAETDLDSVLEALLHMHHNRAVGIDRDKERTCRRLARQAALARRAQQEDR